MMKSVTLGRTEILASQLGLGCMSFAGVYGEVDEAEAVRTVHKAIDLGITMFDTADVYGSGRSEQILGKALSDRRDKAIVATKFGNIDHAGAAPFAEAYDGRWETCGRPDYVQLACEQSLRNLAIDTIDLYYVHRIDSTVPIEDTIGAMSDLVAAGKVRSIGLSEAGESTLRRAHRTHPLTALQSEYSLWSRGAEDWALPLCAELGISYVAYSPLGRGFLTGDISATEQLSEQDWRRHQPRFQAGNYEKNMPLLEVLDQIATPRGCTKAQVALAWVLARGPHILAIPGSKSVGHLTENARSDEIVLTPDELNSLNLAFPPNVAAGKRYPDVQMKRVEL